MKRQDARTPVRPPEPDALLDQHASRVIDAAIEVHSVLGPGFLESVYENALCIELGLRGVPYRRQVPVGVRYKDNEVGQSCLDVLVADRLVVELKAIEAQAPVHWVQVRSYLKATGCLLGLLINFNVPVLLRGVKRVILTR
jgi:GxxExxY protein